MSAVIIKLPTASKQLVPPQHCRGRVSRGVVPGSRLTELRKEREQEQAKQDAFVKATMDVTAHVDRLAYKGVVTGVTAVARLSDGRLCSWSAGDMKDNKARWKALSRLAWREIAVEEGFFDD